MEMKIVDVESKAPLPIIDGNGKPSEGEFWFRGKGHVCSMSVDVCVDICGDMCADLHTGMRVGLGRDMCIALHVCHLPAHSRQLHALDRWFCPNCENS